MDYNLLYKQFNDEFWRYFLGSEKAQNRKGVTWDWWLRKRSRAARIAMHRYLEANGAPNENPFYWIKEFPEPGPTDYNGSADLNRMAATGELVVALYKGAAGIYTRQEAEDFEMTIKRRFEL